MFENNKDLKAVGIISKLHGINGEVILNLITDYPYSIISGTIFYTDVDDIKYLEVEKIRGI
jgi:ribosomal 30S subunit maturation factor RimM